MHAVLQDQTAPFLHVPPGNDLPDAAPSGGGDVDGQPGLADDPAAQERLREAVHRVAPVVLGNGEDLARCVRRTDHPAACPYRQPHGLLHRHVEARVEGVHRKDVVHPGVGYDVDCVQAGLGVKHGPEVRVDARPQTQLRLGYTGHVLGGGAVQVAQRGELEGVEAAPPELGQSIHVAEAHPAAPGLCKLKKRHL